MEDYTGMFVIHGDLFQFDAALGILTHDQNPFNKYKIEHLDFEKDCYRGLYNATKQKIISCRDFPAGTILDGIYEPFSIPREILTEEFRHSEKSTRASNRESIEQKRGFQYVNQELSGRFNGAKGEMTIDGIGYFVDLKKMEIYQKDNPEYKFSFPKNAIHNPTEMFYNTQTKKPVILSNRLTEYPEHVICLMFPKLKYIDPIGYCQLCEYSPALLVSNFQWNPKDMKIPWKDLNQTHFPELVRRNQIEQEIPEKKKNSKKSSLKH